ncbi:hypothetical protein [Aeromicrobium sp. A1-2]|uniref:hypothetical protein n=1 Tax=Aeromicrobium sp. A1-2 TaxID=2107713 RepID=UPI0013C2EFAF|nr:hypothetical protein [Aeromicrobium sp. A1-2]
MTVALLGGAAACSTGHTSPAVLVAPDLVCSRDRTTIDAKNTIERVGGLVGDGFTVRFAESTRLGVVALVDGGTSAAYRELHRD